MAREGQRYLCWWHDICIKMNFALITYNGWYVIKPIQTKLSASCHLFITLHQQCPACFVHLTWMVCEMEGKWPYSCCSVRYCFQDLFKTVYSILVVFPSSFFSTCFISDVVVHPYNSTDTATAWKKSLLILSKRTDFHTIENLSIAMYTNAYVGIAFSRWDIVDEVHELFLLDG